MSSLRAIEPLASIGITLRLLVVTGLLPLLAWLLLHHEDDLVRAAAAVAIAGAAQGLAATIQLLGFDSTWFGLQQYGRYTGFAGHPNDLGAALAVTLPMSLASLFLFAKQRLALVALGLGFLLTIFGLRLSGSLSAVGGAVSGSIATLMVLLGGKRVRRKWPWYGTLILTFAGLIFVLARCGTSLDAGLAAIKDPRIRLSEVVGGEGTLSTRLWTINSAIDDIAESPLIGKGFDHESTDVFEGGQVHSMPILAWQGGGLLVLLGLAGMIWLSFGIVRPGRSKTTFRLRAIRAGLLGSTCAMVVNGLAQPFLYKRFGWIPVALIFSRPILHRPARVPRSPELKPSKPAGYDHLLATNGRRSP
jgi:hypothetical protein